MAQELILKPSRVKYVRMLVFAAMLFAESIYIVARGTSIGRFGTIVGCAATLFFGPGLILSCLSLIPGSSYLKLDPEGFTICSLCKTHRVRWDEVAHFQVSNLVIRKMVVFNFTDVRRGREFARKLSSALAAHQGGLPDTYGRAAEKLAATMNEWRDPALQSAAS